MRQIQFNKNVFINCPFTKDFIPLKRALIFAILSYGYNPMIATKDNNCAEQRLIKIKKLIEQSQYSIHDISMDLPRFNMPFELGIDFGCKYFGKAKYKTKKIFILEAKKYRHKKVLSDIAGMDPKAHNNEPEKIIEIVRTLFTRNKKNKRLEPSTQIWTEYAIFINDLDITLKNANWKLKERKNIDDFEFIKEFKKWKKSTSNFTQV